MYSWLKKEGTQKKIRKLKSIRMYRQFPLRLYLFYSFANGYHDVIKRDTEKKISTMKMRRGERKRKLIENHLRLYNWIHFPQISIPSLPHMPLRE